MAGLQTGTAGSSCCRWPPRDVLSVGIPYKCLNIPDVGCEINQCAHQLWGRLFRGGSLTLRARR